MPADTGGMPDPLGSVSYRDLSWPDQPSDRDDFRATLERRADERTYGICGEPKTVIGAMLCGDPTAVSNACRQSKPDTIDDTLCDDPALHRVQKWFIDISEKASQLVLSATMGRSK
jgi:hypothetical protein